MRSESCTASPLLAPIWKLAFINWPLSSLRPAKEVVSAIRFNSSFKAAISSCNATLSAALFEPLADCKERSRMRCNS
ncbi:Uncharacterised protein [Vibrio cholerae]|nr:Uncharacterised protein [Vibrio cholerae]CSI81916.1 Uncharacterised protein [Vibrio cholerae]